MLIGSSRSSGTQRIKATEHDQQSIATPAPFTTHLLLPVHRRCLPSVHCGIHSPAPLPRYSCHRGHAETTASILLLLLVVVASTGVDTAQIGARLHVWTGYVTVQFHAQVARDVAVGSDAASAAALSAPSNPAQSRSPYWIEVAEGPEWQSLVVV